MPRAPPSPRRVGKRIEGGRGGKGAGPRVVLQSCGGTQRQGAAQRSLPNTSITVTHRPKGDVRYISFLHRKITRQHKKSHSASYWEMKYARRDWPV